MLKLSGRATCAGVFLGALLATTLTQAWADPASVPDASSTVSGSADDTKTAEGVVRTIIKKAAALDDRAKHAEYARTIEGLVDFRRLTHDALGSHADDASPAQAKDVETLLKSIITRTVYPEAPKFFRDVTIAYNHEQDGSNGQIHITSVLTKGTKKSTVEYWLLAEGAGFKVIDVSIEGERWVENVRDQFDEVIGKKGFNGLIERMRKRVGELKPVAN